MRLTQSHMCVWRTNRAEALSQRASLCPVDVCRRDPSQDHDEVASHYPVHSPVACGREHPQSSVHGRAAQPGVGRRHHLCMDHGGVALSRRDPRSVLAPCDRQGDGGDRLTVELAEHALSIALANRAPTAGCCTTRIAAASMRPRVTSVGSTGTASPSA